MERTPSTYIQKEVLAICTEEELELLDLFADTSLSSAWAEENRDPVLCISEESFLPVEECQLLPDEQQGINTEASLGSVAEPVFTFSYQDTGVLIPVPDGKSTENTESTGLSDLQILEKILVDSREEIIALEDHFIEEQKLDEERVLQAEQEGRVIWIEDYHPLTGQRCRIPIIIDKDGIATTTSTELMLDQKDLQRLVEQYDFIDGAVIDVDTIAGFGFVALASSMAAAACPDGCGGGGHAINGAYGTLFSFPPQSSSHSHSFGEKGIAFYYCPKCKKTGHTHGKAEKCKCGNKNIKILKSKKEYKDAKAA